MPRSWARLFTLSRLKDAFTNSWTGSQRPLAGAKRKQLLWSQLHQDPQDGDLVFSSLGWPAWITQGLGSFPGSCSEAVMEQSIYAWLIWDLAQLEQLPVLTQVSSKSHLWPYHSNTVTALYPEGSFSVNQFSNILCHQANTRFLKSSLEFFPSVKCLILQSMEVWNSVNT